MTNELLRVGKLIVSAMALASTLYSSASCAQGPGWTTASTVVQVVVTSNGGINVRLSPELTGCTSQGGYGVAYASIYPTNPGLKQMHANLLTAYATGTPVALYFSDNTCTVGEMILGGTPF